MAPELRDQLQKHLLHKHHASDLEAITEAEEAVELAGAALAMAVEDLRGHAGFGANSATEFDDWMREIGADAQLESDAKAAPPPDLDSLAAQLHGLGSDDRFEVIDRVLNKATTAPAA